MWYRRLFLFAVICLATHAAFAADQLSASKTVIDLQAFRRVTRLDIAAPGGRGGTATLTELNPQINAWYLLELDWQATAKSRAQHLSYHLENPDPDQQGQVRLDAAAGGLHFELKGKSLDCPLWTNQPMTQLEQARASALPYAPLCEHRLYLRNPVAGSYTRIEKVTNLLRDYVAGGDKIVGFIRDQFYQDAFIEHGAARRLTEEVVGVAGALSEAPRPAKLNPTAADLTVTPEHLGIDTGTPGLQPGRWYPARDAPGVYISAIQPGMIDPEILRSARSEVNGLDSVEAGALDYLVAFDLDRYEIGFVLGTDHPRVGWSERTLDTVRDPRLPGPDGIANTAPLITNGMVNPARVGQAVATFTGGFKRQHGAFRYGPLATMNSGSHYGFIEQGTLFSTLQSGLSTLYVLDDGSVGMKTWNKNTDDVLLPRIRAARQNGVALIEYDAATGHSSPGIFVNRWGPGNWSGSDKEDLRTLRSGACLAEDGEHRFLIYGYFSTATPSAMARVFQAYGCRYAMHLDMNALEHTYLALYTHKSGNVFVQHLIQGMAEVDRKSGGGEYAPRFLNFADDRDFFYVVPRSQRDD